MNTDRRWRRYVSLSYLVGKARERGIVWCLKIGTFKIFRRILWGIFALLLVVPLCVLYLLGVRFLPIRYYRAIGHLTLEPDCYLKEEILGVHPRYITIMLAPVRKEVINRSLLEYWRQYFKIVTSPILYSLLYPFSRHKMVQYDIAPYLNDYKTALAYAINTKWVGKPPLLSLRKSDFQRGWDRLRNLGVPEGAWFVCVHAREPGNRPQDAAHTCRDVDICTYFSAMEAIVERGGWCVRMGDTAMKRLPPMKNVIDYAHHSVRSDWMDVFLCASCRFFLGCGSGLTFLACVFGVPCALTNLIPMSVLPLRHTDIGIPKLMWSHSKGRYLTYQEVLNSPIGNFQCSDLYATAGIKVVDNSPEDVNDLAIEMFNLTEGTMVYTAEDERLQERFKSLLKPGHYSYGASSRVGRDFLRKYASFPNR